MKPMLKIKRKLEKKLYYTNGIEVVEGPNPNMNGYFGDIWGDCTNISGDTSNISGVVTTIWGYVSELRGKISGTLYGDVSGLAGDVTGLSGNLTGIYGKIPDDLCGNVNFCEITDEDRDKGIHIQNLIK